MAATTVRAPAPFFYKYPVTNINGVLPGGVATINLQPVNRESAIIIEATVTKAAKAASTSVPLVTDIAASYQFKVNGKPQRTRNGLETWGAGGLNAICDAGSGGMVVYTQVGNANLSIYPVLIGSAADLAQQALLTQNLATTAVFQLPIQFAEPFRKDYWTTQKMALVQARSDGTNIGPVTVEVTIPNNTAAAWPFSGHGIKAYHEYDTLVAAPGATIKMMKEYRWQVPYTAAGQVECALQIPNARYNTLNRVRLLTTSDIITEVVVKQGPTILRDILYTRMQAELIRKDYNQAGLNAAQNGANLYAFDIEFDENDDPGQAPKLNPNAPLSILATLGSANGNQVIVLASMWGPLD